MSKSAVLPVNDVFLAVSYKDFYISLEIRGSKRRQFVVLFRQIDCMSFSFGRKLEMARY